MKTGSGLFVTAAFLILSFTTGQVASAALLAGNQLTANSNSSFSSEINFTQQANNFMLSTSASVESITWWGIYSGGSPLTDDFTVRILQDNGSAAPIADETMAPLNVTGITPTRVDSGFVSGVTGPNPIYEYTFDLPSSLMLDPGTYYLSVVNNTAGEEWAWSANDSTGSRWRRDADGIAWGSLTSELTFQINGTSAAVPEPGSMMLLGTVGVLGLCSRLRRRRKNQEPE